MPKFLRERPATETMKAGESKKGYPWLFFYARRPWGMGLLVSLIVIGLCGAYYVWYSHSGNDTAPDSAVGLDYAVLGLIFLILAAGLYSIRRRLRKRTVGRLNIALNWHVFLAIMGLAVLFMHSFGNFEAVSGTYALFGLVALTISGFIGRTLDHFMPRLIAREVDKVLTSEGDDRIESVSQNLQAIVAHNTQRLHGFRADNPHPAAINAPSDDPSPNGFPVAANGQVLSFPWDLAYISLEPTQQELDHDAPRYRFIPDKKSALSRPGAMMPGAAEQISELQDIHRAMQREQLYRYVIRYWRMLHILLAFMTLGLVTWHIIFAMELLLPGMFH